MFEVFDVYDIRLSKIVFVLFELANCTCVVVSRIFSVGRLLAVRLM